MKLTCHESSNASEKSASRVFHLEKHSEVHTFKEFPCDECAKRFTSPRTLESRKLRHLDERLLHCDVPGCSFVGKLQIDIDNHKQVHENPDYNCHLCGKFIEQLRHIKIHTALHESGIAGVFKCSVHGCVRSNFTSTDELKNHFMLDHNSKANIAQMVNSALIPLPAAANPPLAQMEIDLKTEELVID
jgi:hypothetical protein